MTHPSIQGLREAVSRFECESPSRHDKHGDNHRCYRLADTLLMKVSAYLTEHGVLLSGEGLERLEWAGTKGRLSVYRTVPIPQDPEEEDEALDALAEAFGKQEHLDSRRWLCTKCGWIGPTIETRLIRDDHVCPRCPYSLVPVPQDGE